MAAFSRQAESSYSIIRWTSGFWIERCAVCAGAQYSGCDRRSADTHLETFRRLLHPTEGEIVSIRRPIRIDGGRDGSDLPAPTLGQHSGEVLLELDYDDASIAKMKSAKVIW